MIQPSECLRAVINRHFTGKVSPGHSADEGCSDTPVDNFRGKQCELKKKRKLRFTPKSLKIGKKNHEIVISG